MSAKQPSAVEDATSSQPHEDAGGTSKNELILTFEDGSTCTIKLNFWDRIMRRLLSKEEFEARMLEKIEKAKKAHRRKVGLPEPQP